MNEVPWKCQKCNYLSRTQAEHDYHYQQAHQGCKMTLSGLHIWNRNIRNAYVRCSACNMINDTGEKQLCP